METAFSTIKNYNLIKNGDKIAVALGGGKKSLVLLHVLTKYAKTKNINCKIFAVHVNLGLDFSKKAEQAVQKQCEYLKTELKIVRLSEMGIDLYKLSKQKNISVCSCCNPVKRYMINRKARESGANIVATGHNTEDFIVLFFKDILNQKYSMLGKLKPRVPSEHPKMLEKIRPLFNTTNEKIDLINVTSPFLKDDLCIYRLDMRRGFAWYKTIEIIEQRHKNFKKHLINSLTNIRVAGEPKKTCKSCAEASSSDICIFCRITGGYK